MISYTCSNNNENNKPWMVKGYKYNPPVHSYVLLLARCERLVDHVIFPGQLGERGMQALDSLRARK